MGKISKFGRSAATGRMVTVNVAARERTVPRSSAAYVYAGGRGEAAYKLTKIIEGSGRRFSVRSAKTGRFLGGSRAEKKASAFKFEMAPEAVKGAD